MWRVLYTGASLASACWPVAIALWLVNLVFGAVFAFASGYWLYLALDDSLASRTLLRDLDPNVLIDLFFHHGEGLGLLLLVAALLAVVYLSLWFCFHGVIISAVRAPAEATLRDVWLAGLQATSPMARVFSLAMLMMAVLCGTVGLAVWGGLRWTVASPTGMLWSYITFAGLLTWAIATVFLTAVHDHARIRACISQEGALKAYRWAFWFVLGGRRNAYSLALVLQSVGLGLWLTFQWVSSSFPTDQLVGVTGSLVLGALFMLVRMWVRVWVFASESQLQR